MFQDTGQTPMAICSQKHMFPFPSEPADVLRAQGAIRTPHLFRAGRGMEAEGLEMPQQLARSCRRVGLSVGDITVSFHGVENQ